jgi:hypothetical protein
LDLAEDALDASQRRREPRLIAIGRCEKRFRIPGPARSCGRDVRDITSIQFAGKLEQILRRAPTAVQQNGGETRLGPCSPTTYDALAGMRIGIRGHAHGITGT